jgi:thioredoxin-like negative regulator of GroEL
MLSKVLEAVAQELGDTVRFVKVDTDEEGDLSSQLGIEALPTLIFIPSNKEKRAYRVEGMLPAEEIKRVLEEIA